MQPQTFVFYGIIGSGKGTQVKFLTDFLKEKNGLETVYAGTGDGFRQLVASGSYTGSLVKDFIERGQLVPDFLTNAIFTNVLISQLTPEKNLIADGYPRTVAQSESFERKMQFFKREDIKIIYIEISEEEAIRRNIVRGRHDDTEHGIKKRIQEYKDNVVHSMAYFKDKPGYTIYAINGEQEREAVHKDIIKALGY